jgi:hypothetical protein
MGLEAEFKRINYQLAKEDESMSIEITIIATPDVAERLRSNDRGTPDSERIFQFAESHGLTVRPLHSNVDDLESRKYFVAEPPPGTTYDEARSIGERLQSSCRGIEAAYVKPPDEMPAP